LGGAEEGRRGAARLGRDRGRRRRRASLRLAWRPEARRCDRALRDRRSRPRLPRRRPGHGRLHRRAAPARRGARRRRRCRPWPARPTPRCRCARRRPRRHQRASPRPARPARRPLRPDRRRSVVHLARARPAGARPARGRRAAAPRQAAVRAAAGRHRQARPGARPGRLRARRAAAARSVRRLGPRGGRLVRKRHRRRRRQPRVLPARTRTAMTTIATPVPVSFEFFPPNTPVGSEKLKTVVAELAQAQPEFFSVTYGAGGSTRDKTLATVCDIAALGHQAAPHLSCVGSTRQGIAETLATYRAQKIGRLVALRGDLPSGTATAGEFRFASELIAFIREAQGSDWFIEVAAYPEYHPQQRYARRDLQHFAAKVKSGANSAITQFFFNPDAYFHYVDEVRALGVE